MCTGQLILKYQCIYVPSLENINTVQCNTTTMKKTSANK